MTAFLVLTGIGLLAWIIGAFVLVSGRRTQAKTNLIHAVPTSPAVEIGNLIPGESVEVAGTLRCASPLTGEISQRACAWYESQVIREYEERERDAKGNWTTRRRSETISSNTQFVPFIVEDASGQVEVLPDGAEVDPLNVTDRFEKSNDAGGPSFSIPGLNVSIGSGSGTLGYRYVEKILPVDAPVYVLGVVREDGRIGAPDAERQHARLIISHRSEESLTQSWAKSARMKGYGAVGSFILGAILVVIGFTTLIV